MTRGHCLLEDNKKMIRIYSADVSSLSDPKLFRASYSAVGDERQSKIDRLRRRGDKRLSLGAGILLRYALREYGTDGIPEYAYGENGKPYIAGGPYFSLSHSGNIAVCAVADCEVGVDVEEIGTANMKLARRFFQPEEYALLSSAGSDEERNELFFRFWTLKESLMKCTGLGLGLSPREFRAVPGESATEYGGRKFYFGEFSSLPGCCCAVCSGEQFPEVDFSFFSNIETVLAQFINL